MKTLSTRIIKELGEALRDFGTYTFDDKGPSEVMDVSSLVADLRKLPVVEAAVVLNEVATSKKYKGRGLYLASELVGDLQDWDELFTQPGIDDIYGGDLPGESQPATPCKPIQVVSAADIMEKLKNS